MTKLRKVVLALLVVVSVGSLLFAQGATQRLERTQDIVVLYTNDVHCGIEDNNGYAGLYNYKQQMLKETSYVTLVDAGDAVQGDTIGTVSKGEYLVDIMNAVGYDFAIFGNHEFDYGMDRLQELVGMADAQYLASNIIYNGTEGNKLGAAKPYEIVTYGTTKVAFIGVSTRESLVKSTPKYFQENGEYVYDFLTGDALIENTQTIVNEARANGADYVFIVCHLGLEEVSADKGTDLCTKLYGVDAVIDGHSHDAIETATYKNAKGEDVLYTQSGTKFANIGKLTIKADGSITTEFVQAEKDPVMSAYIDSVKAKYESAVNGVVAASEYTLSTNENGTRVVRNKETAIGDLCADAYRTIAATDVAFVNGGGIRADINAGDLTLANIIAIHPYGNMLCSCYATGQEILDALEWGSQNTQAVAQADGKAVGESGGFLQVSGLKYTIDTSVPTSVVKDENGMFAGVEGERRVKDVFVLEGENWVAIDPEKTYTVSCHNYKLQDMGDGYTMFADNEFILDCTMIDNQVLITYITDYLGGVIGAQYAEPQGRITII